MVSFGRSCTTSRPPPVVDFERGWHLADYERDSDQWRDTDYRFLVEQLLSSFAEYQPTFRQYLAPIAPKCLPDLEDKFAKCRIVRASTAWERPWPLPNSHRTTSSE